MRTALIFLFLIAAPVFAFGGCEIIKVADEFSSPKMVETLGLLMVVMSFGVALVAVELARRKEG